MERSTSCPNSLSKRTIYWIVEGRTPLNNKQLCRALAVSLGDSDLDMDNIPGVENVFSVCAGLITVDEETNMMDLSSPQNSMGAV